MTTGANQPTASDWYRDGVIYELHVRSFRDSNGDGIGDFDGLTSKLDHLVNLGVTAVWLLPFYPSPGRDDGYDIADYTAVNPAYGDLRSFRRFLRAAHDRDLKVITELVVNHTSDQHPWFQRARRAAPGSTWRNLYVWSDDPDKYGDARIIFSDTETSNWTWDPVAGAYYWHRFFSHQPDLNFENEMVQERIRKVADFWLEMGVDGLRLDAVPYLFEEEGTNCENLPETHEFLRSLRKHIDDRYENRMLLAEANQWPEDAAAYFGNGDECHMNFHFPVMPRLYVALQTEQRTPIVDILEQTPEPPEGCQWAMFLRNHDELTLEMVTDEERDAMYRAYARDPEMRLNVGIRRRLAPLLGNDRRTIELLNAIVFSLPGTPVVYYGDEIGMGDNVYLGDRDGVRTPMQWSPDRNAGFSDANPQRLYLPPVIDPSYHYEHVNVEVQHGDPTSLLWWTGQLVALRRRLRVLGRGSIEFLDADNHHVLAYLRHLEGEPSVLVVANLSRHAQPVELPIAGERGATPVELFGHTRFPTIGDDPYPLTLAPHGFFWFELEAPVAGEALDDLELREIGGTWPALALQRGNDGLDRALVDLLRRSRWYSGERSELSKAKVVDAFEIGSDADAVVVAVVEARTVSGATDEYVVPMAWRAERAHGPATVEIARAGGGVIIDALTDPEGVSTLLSICRSRRRTKGRAGSSLTVSTSPALRALLATDPVPAVGSREQSNSSVVIGDGAIMKLIRRLGEGQNPELEVGRALTAQRFPWAPAVMGAIEMERSGNKVPRTLAVVTELVPNDGDAWDMTMQSLGWYYDAMIAGVAQAPDGTDPRLERLLVSTEDAARLGEGLGALHRALASVDAPGFETSRLGKLGVRALAQNVRSQLRTTFGMLRRARRRLDEDIVASIDELLPFARPLLDEVLQVASRDIEVLRLRVHGDLHLGQVLVRGLDHHFIDFEGEPTRPISERRITRTALVDVAGMLRSYDYAAQIAARHVVERGGTHGATEEELSAWGEAWSSQVGAAFLDHYRTEVEGLGLVPTDPDAEAQLLRVCLIEKVAYEIRYELAHRPELLPVPIRGLMRLIAQG